MIHIQTQLNVIDNSGAKRVQTIKIYRGKWGQVGDVIQVSVKHVQAKTKLKISKGSIWKALIVRSKSNNKSALNHYLSFNENSVILLTNQNVPIASRILGPVPLFLRNQKQIKILALASTLI
jgi:large subunit ribosomal protein L14